MPKYNSVENIGAKTFFEILKTKNYQLLCPKPREKGLEVVFMAIYDEFFIKSDNDEAKEYLRLTNEINFLKYKINTLKQSLQFYYYTKTTEKMRSDFAKALKEGFNVVLDLTVPFTEEVLRVLTIEIGAIMNDLSIAEIDFKQMIEKSKGKDFDYFDAIVGLSNVMPGNSLLKEEMTLATYISLEKAAKKIISQQQQANKKIK